MCSNCSDKKSARIEDLTFGLKKKKDINSKRNVRKTTGGAGVEGGKKKKKPNPTSQVMLHHVSFNVTTIEMGVVTVVRCLFLIEKVWLEVAAGDTDLCHSTN